MADPNPTTTTPFGLPLQPTGSGVVDLEIAREQDALANEDGAAALGDMDEEPEASDRG